MKKENQNPNTRQAKRSRVEKQVKLQAVFTPRTANTNNKICSMKRDNVSTKNYWMLTGEKHITIAKQKSGEQNEWMVEIPKKDFNRIIKFYETGK